MYSDRNSTIRPCSFWNFGPAVVTAFATAFSLTSSSSTISAYVFGDSRARRWGSSFSLGRQRHPRSHAVEVSRNLRGRGWGHARFRARLCRYDTACGYSIEPEVQFCWKGQWSNSFNTRSLQRTRAMATSSISAAKAALVSSAQLSPSRLRWTCNVRGRSGRFVCCSVSPEQPRRVPAPNDKVVPNNMSAPVLL